MFTPNRKNNGEVTLHDEQDELQHALPQKKGHNDAADLELLTDLATRALASMKRA